MNKTTVTVRCIKCRRSFPYNLDKPANQTVPRLQRLLCPHCKHQGGSFGVWEGKGGLVQEIALGKRVTIRVLYPEEATGGKE